MNKDEILVPILTAINDLREEVRENRKAKKLTQEELGDIIGASAPHIGQIERANFAPHRYSYAGIRILCK